MVNTKLLDSKIESSGMKVSFIIEKMGISRSAFYKKKDNKISFRVSEVYVISDLLRLTESEKQEIFFG